MSGVSLLLQGDGFFGLPPIVPIGLALVLVVFFYTAMFVKQYKRCPSNRILVIYGKTGPGKGTICMHGGARFVVPSIQDHDWLSLEPMRVEIPLRGTPSRENAHVNVPAVFTVAIGTTPELMQNAAARLLGLPCEAIEKQAEEIISGRLRPTIGSTAVEDVNRDRDKFLESIQSSLEPELKKIGLVLLGVDIRDVADEPADAEVVDAGAATALLHQLLAAFDGSAPRLVAHLLQEGRLTEEDRREIRRLLDAPRSST